MNKLTSEEMKFVEEYLTIIERIVITSACSSIPPTYLEGLKEINKKYKMTQCITCNSSIFLATNQLYKNYIWTKQQIEKEKEIIENGRRKRTTKIEKRKTSTEQSESKEE